MFPIGKKVGKKCYILSVIDDVINKNVQKCLPPPYGVNVMCFLFQTACLSVVVLLLWDMGVAANFFPHIFIFHCLSFSKRSIKV